MRDKNIQALDNANGIAPIFQGIADGFNYATEGIASPTKELMGDALDAIVALEGGKMVYQGGKFIFKKTSKTGIASLDSTLVSGRRVGCVEGGVSKKSGSVSTLAEVDGNIFNIKDPYVEAMSGGKHSIWTQNYLSKTTQEIEKGIKSFDKQIKIHQDKIRNPKKHIPKWDDLDLRHQQDLIIKKWPQDIARQQEQKNILETILRNRNAK